MAQVVRVEAAAPVALPRPVPGAEPGRGLGLGGPPALPEALPAVYAEVPPGVQEALLRRLGALARSRRAALILRPLRGGLPVGLAHLNLVGEAVLWEGAGSGHGRVTRRRLP